MDIGELSVSILVYACFELFFFSVPFFFKASSSNRQPVIENILIFVESLFLETWAYGLRHSLFTFRIYSHDKD